MYSCIANKQANASLVYNMQFLYTCEKFYNNYYCRFMIITVF